MKLKEVKDLIKREGLDAFLFSSQANVFYLSGFRSTHAYAVITPDSQYLLTDSRYWDRAKEELKGWDVVLIKGKAVSFIKGFLRERGLTRVGYESDRVSCDLRKSLRSTRIKWKGYSGFLKEIRAVKTREEIELMREGVKRSDKIYMELLNYISPGMRELEVRGFIVGKIFEYGGTGESFPAIVASAEGSAVPHWESSHKKLKASAPVLIDMGLIWKGYCTDFTRTFYLGSPDEEFLKVYNIVKDAHLFALDKARVGSKLGDVDRAAREYIEEKNYGKYFTHTTGHGIGVEIHEYPRVYYKGEDANRYIEEGMVFTIEPGIYLPGKFGVRLENIVAIVNGRGEPLSGIDLELVKV
ncbi:Xaa-Pro aminopeptidase/Xaa-Pro dipeptidase [Hydrogenivirga caldilitoris]|uniref:Xaa-Pro aminopeptidase/Xaa-Pro dipeptidase n=1 Tax=Hydrogenivirga caldilitoris TaxID=246264 RepID=A0A497XRA0_9AQUI|nr:aminopeptidase P family protein [Hydrogenivirga caldilitoris]RLJ70794.1 Xaa-Pro aminopeptidase/Xaa-Pro dipeptidase [Hydrogenivirga caldilitoris]